MDPPPPWDSRYREWRKRIDQEPKHRLVHLLLWLVLLLGVLPMLIGVGFVLMSGDALERSSWALVSATFALVGATIAFIAATLWQTQHTQWMEDRREENRRSNALVEPERTRTAEILREVLAPSWQPALAKMLETKSAPEIEAILNPYNISLAKVAYLFPRFAGPISGSRRKARLSAMKKHDPEAYEEEMRKEYEQKEEADHAWFEMKQALDENGPSTGPPPAAVSRWQRLSERLRRISKLKSHRNR